MFNDFTSFSISNSDLQKHYSAEAAIQMAYIQELLPLKIT